MKKNKKFISACLLLAFFLFSNQISAQLNDTLWTFKPIGNAWQNSLRYVIQTQDQQFVAAGHYFTEETQEDVWAIKFSAYGEIPWNKTYQTDISQPWLSEGIRGLAEMSTGELVIFAANQEYKHYMIFLNQQGNQTGIINYLGSDDPYYVYAATTTDDDNFLVAGNHAVWENNNWFHYSWYRKIDASGNMIWEHSFPPVRWDDRFNCIGKMPDGGFILAGTSDTPTNYDEILLVRIDAQGDTLWTRRWGTTVFDYPEEIVPTPDGGFILAATKSYFSSYKGYLLKLDADGHEEWMQTYNDYDDDHIRSVKRTTDGGYIIAGEHKPANAEPHRFWIMKTDADGNKLQSLDLGDDSGIFRGFQIIQSHDGSYYAVGQTPMQGWIVKISPNFGSTGISETELLAVELFPNPTRGQFKVQSSKFKVEFQSLELIDIYGKVLQTLNPESGILTANCELRTVNCELNISHLPSGIYFIRIQSENQTIGKKIVKF